MNRSHLYLAAGLTLLLIATPFRLHADDELIANPKFDNAMDSWTPMNLQGATAKFEAKEYEPGKHAVCITVPTAAEKRYYVQLDQNLTTSMSASKTYTLSFRVKSKPASSIVITMGTRASEGVTAAELWRQDKIDLTEEWQTLSFPVKLTADAPTPYLNISGLAATAGEYWFTDVSLKAAADTPAGAPAPAPASK